MSGAAGVVVVGGGQAGSDAVAALRAGGLTEPLTLVGDEREAPYRRPPLTKSLLREGTSLRQETELLPPSWYQDQDVDLVRGDRGRELDLSGRRLVLASGRVLGYTRLVLATGAAPVRPDVPGADLDGVHTVRTLADARALRASLERPGAGPLVVVGGGFLGLEVAASAREAGHEVTVVEAAGRVLSRAVSTPLAGLLAAEHLRRGVRLLVARTVRALLPGAGGRVGAVELADGARLPAGTVVVAVGVRPRTGLAARAGLATGSGATDGILVDALLRTSDPEVYAIGDCARFTAADGASRRLESVQNASGHARAVAETLCGRPTPYTELPWFWSDQYGCRLQIAGLGQGHDRAVTVGDVSAGRYTVFCFRGERLVAAESVNRPADHMITRRLLSAGGPGPGPLETAAPGFDLKAWLARREGRAGHGTPAGGGARDAQPVAG
ncbi:NAD(P)/FAD-dependent oxidoreductase [Streptomyces sp. CA-294286]|uniref:NAD(P)/FAD-dependent oxidoreductase n=1 Tax=Streptomyces sp. CA-294286 TaxID=3240070 RepID=UPI003D89DCE3